MKGRDLTEVSKKLRRQTTPWEAKLWYYLRGHRFYDLKFKRQVPMGNYIVDFCCQEKKLVIELDGGQHSETLVADNDRLKQEFLERHFYKVLRFWNNEIDNNIEGVLEVVRKAVA
jgi:very-short-patch-repair endonuclease